MSDDTLLTLEQRAACETSKGISEAQDAKTAAAMQVKLDAALAQVNLKDEMLRVQVEASQSWEKKLRAKGQALVDAAENMLKEDSGVDEWAAIRLAIGDWSKDAPEAAAEPQ